MTDAPWMQGPPRTILLATDLSARCDRALDRAVQLASAWGAKLLVVHAIEPDAAGEAWAVPSWRRAADPVAIARERLHADLGDHAAGIEIDVRVEPGLPVEMIIGLAEREGCGLIVTGVARDQTLGRMLTGSTVDALLRKAPVPVLVVRNRPRGPYDAVTVATDFSRSSRHGLEAAVRLFPEAPLTLFHGYDIPFAGYLETESIVGEFAQMGEQAADRFLADADVPEGTAGRARRVIERGVVEDLLRDYGRTHPLGLVVVGSHGGGALYRAFIGSTATKIVENVPADVLVVRDPAAG